MKLRAVTIEGMHKVEHQHINLTNISYLFGPNGAGKSTIMEAIQLGLLGYIPGTPKTKEAIFKHANGPVMSVSVDIDDGNDGVVIKRTWTRSRAGIQADVNVTPATYNIDTLVSDIELPIFNFSEFIGMTANKLKDWFIQFLPSVAVSIDWNRKLRDSLSDEGIPIQDEDMIVDTINNINNISTTGSEKIRQVNELLKTMLSFKNKEMSRITSTIQSLVFYDDIDTSVSEDQIITQLKELDAARDNIRDIERLQTQNASIMAELNSYSDCTADSCTEDARYIDIVDTLPKLSAELSQIQTELAEMEIKKSQYDNRRYSLSVERDRHVKSIDSWESIIDSGGICPYTKDSCAAAQKIIENCRENKSATLKLISAVDDEIEEIGAQIDPLHSAMTELQDRELAIQSEISTKQALKLNIESRYAEKQSLIDRVVAIPEQTKTLAEIDAEIEELRSLQIKYAANENYNRLIDELTHDKVATDIQIEMLKCWIKLTGVNGMQNDEAVTAPFVNLQENMDTYIQAIFGCNVHSQFNLESKANSFSFGLNRDGKYIPFNLLSSGEKCLYTLTLMTSLVELSKSPLKLVLIDDFLDHLDDANILKLFEVFSTVTDIQMVFAGVKLVRDNCIVINV